MHHTYSLETLVHYQCGACKQWWTIGDDRAGRCLSCPGCGHRADTIPKAEYDVPMVKESE